MATPPLNGGEKERSVENKEQHTNKAMTNVTVYPILETNIVHVKHIKESRL